MFDKEKIEKKIIELRKEGKSPEEISSIINHYHKGYYDGLDEKMKGKVKARIYRRYHILREMNFSEKEAFFKLTDELIDNGIDPEEHGLGINNEPRHFAKGFDRYKKRQSKK